MGWDVKYALAGAFIKAVGAIKDIDPIILIMTRERRTYSSSEAGNVVGRIRAERLFMQKAGRELSLLPDTAEQRYLKLFKERPNFTERIPLKFISSYIGITPQALSRIRRRIS